ncbi:MAG: GNAT family N-acetyltransferase [Erysipelotrichaceae bacterium]|nr:GNAT family N-acetyltransferase [Erysipelotrichaceae bacterium]
MINMRLARPQDAEKLGQLYYRCWMDLYPEIVEKDKFQGITLEEAVNDFKSTKCRDIIEGWAGDELVGFCSFGNCRDDDVLRDTGEVYRLYVLKDFQQRGEGRRLLHEAIRMLRREEYNQVVIWTLVDNPYAISFYEALGFKHDGTVRYAKDSPLQEMRFFMNI